MSNVKISELETTSAVSTSDLMETAIPSGNNYASKKMSIAQLATYLENSVVHSALDTQNKTIIDAINELKSICDNLSASHFIVANQLPTSDINMNAIYLIPKQSTGVNDVYEEYICLDDTTTPVTWEKIGETQIDLSNYITFDDADIATTSKNGSMSKADRSKMNGIESGAQKNVQSDWNAASGDAFIKNKPTIPDELADLADDSTHRLVTDTEKSTWNNKSATDEKVKQVDLYDTSNVNYYMLLSYSNSLTEETQPVWKATDLRYNPSTNKFYFNGITIDIVQTEDLYLKYGNSLVVFSLDSTYDSIIEIRPPHESGELALITDISKNAVLWKQQNVLGAKNQLPYPYNQKIGTSRGVDYEMLPDGSYHIYGTNNSTSASYVYLIGSSWKDQIIVDKKSRVSWTGTGTGLDFVTLNVTKRVGSSGKRTNVKYVSLDDYVDIGAESNTRYDFEFSVAVGKAVDVYVYPLMRYIEISDDTYTPPTRTNRELTVGKCDLEDIATIENSSIASKAYAVNEFMIWYGRLHRVKSAIASGDTITTGNSGNVEATTLSAQLKQIRDALSI